MQTILGAGGPVSNSLRRVLEKGGQPLRLVSRRQVATAGNTSWTGADLKDYPALLDAARGSSVIYMCAGLQYDRKVWQEEWPLIMRNLINVTRETGANLIFFDNVYMYGRVQGPMTEETPYNPESVKGEVRARIATTLMEEAGKGNIRATIARAADFYGAESRNSFFDTMVLDKLAKGGKAQWLGNPATLHSFTYVPDIGTALALLGAKPEQANQVWHLPTAPARTGAQLIGLAAAAFHTTARYSRVNKNMLRLAGLFNKTVRDAVEMYYQYGYDYNFSSAKFGQAFGIAPTSYEEGIRALTTTLLGQ